MNRMFAGVIVIALALIFSAGCTVTAVEPEVLGSWRGTYCTESADQCKEQSGVSYEWSEADCPAKLKFFFTRAETRKLLEVISSLPLHRVKLSDIPVPLPASYLYLREGSCNISNG